MDDTLNVDLSYIEFCLILAVQKGFLGALQEVPAPSKNPSKWFFA
jgi:hypothetical protein